VRQLEVAAASGPLVANPVIYAELSVGFERIEDLDQFVTAIEREIQPFPWPGLFLAGKVFRNYRARRGGKTGVLPDFFLGAHAAIAGLPLLTRDVGRYRTWFPAVMLITRAGS
jgi:predicted nucleic acid-binding protein